MKFCPKCGKENNTGNTLCKDCDVIKTAVKEVEVRVCDKCKTYFQKGKQVPFQDIEKVAKAIVEEKTGMKVTSILMRKKTADLDNGQSVRINLMGGTCQKCGKTGTNYFEGTLQLRNPNKDVIEFIKSEVKKSSSKGVSINKVEKSGSGVDFYFSSQKCMQAIAKKIHAEFGGIIKTSSRLFSKSRQTSKDIYRVSILIEIPGFAKDDVIKVEEKIVLVKGFGSRASGTDLATGKTVMFSYDSETKALKKYKTSVSKNYPQLELIHPITFQSIEPENPSRHKRGEKVKVVIDEGKVYII